VATPVRLPLANFGAVAAAFLMAGLIGVIALTGRWPVDAPRTHLDSGGILSLPAAQVSRIDIATGVQHVHFSRLSASGWLVNDAPARGMVADHVAAALRILAVSAPRRVLGAGEYSAGQLAEFGLDPPRFVVAVAAAGGNSQLFGFGEATAAENAQYVRIVGRPEIYLLSRIAGEEWRFVRDTAMRAPDLLLPVPIGQIWAIEIVRGGILTRLERDPAGLWFHHVPHPNQPGLAHRADPKLAQQIAAELDALDRTAVAATTRPHPDAEALAAAGLVHPDTILLLYSRDTAGPVARIEFGNTVADGSLRWVRLQRADNLVTAPADAEKPLAALLQLAGTS
jgi:Domain of unknown function (DUF4340)